MAGVIVFVKVAGQEKYRRLSRRLKDAGRGDLQRRLTTAIRREGDPALSAVRGAWRGVDVTSSAGGGRRSTGLRARVAASTRVYATANGIRVQVDSARVDRQYGRQLVYGLDALRRWSHPVFGNRNVWVQQRGQEVFFSTLTGFEHRWRSGIEREMDTMAAEIEG
jgi:hypothetical protein